MVLQRHFNFSVSILKASTLLGARVMWMVLVAVLGGAVALAKASGSLPEFHCWFLCPLPCFFSHPCQLLFAFHLPGLSQAPLLSLYGLYGISHDAHAGQGAYRTSRRSHCMPWRGRVPSGRGLIPSLASSCILTKH